MIDCGQGCRLYRWQRNTTDERQSCKTVFRVIPKRVVIWHFCPLCGLGRTPILMFSVKKKIVLQTPLRREKDVWRGLTTFWTAKTRYIYYYILILTIIIFILHHNRWFRSQALQNNIILSRGFVYTT